MDQTQALKSSDDVSTGGPSRVHSSAAVPGSGTAASSSAESTEATSMRAGVISRRNAIKRVATSTALGAAGLPRLGWARTSDASQSTGASPRRTRTATTFLTASQAPTEFSLPVELESVPFDQQAGFDLPIGRFRATFIPRAGLLGPEGDPQRLLQESTTMAMVVTCLKDIWWIESEPAGGQTFSMVAYAADQQTRGSSRTAVLSGQGVVAADGEKRIEFSLQTVPALAHSAAHDQIAASVTSQPDGSYEGRVDVVEEQYHKGGHGHGECHKRCDNKSGGAQGKCHRRCRKNKKS